MWSCCGLFGRKHGRQKEDEAGPSERTPLIRNDPEADALPFVPQIQPRALDDKALQEYHARIDRILAEAAEKFVSVSTAPTLGYRKARSATTASSSSGRRSVEKRATGQIRKAKDAVDEPSGRDTLWRAEAPHHAHGGPGGSVYSLQKVIPSKGKGKAKDTTPDLAESTEEDEDKYGTVATYKTAQVGQSEGTSENEADSDDEGTLESGQATPTTLDRSMTEDSEEGALDATIGKKGNKSGRLAVQEIWSHKAKSGRRKQPSEVETKLRKTLELPNDDFAKLLTQ